MPRPRKYDESTRDLLIEQAAAVIAQAGTEALALRPLAQTCGCTTTTIYTLFGGRDQLIEAVTSSVTESFTASQQGVPRTSDPLGDLRALGLAYRAWALEHPAFYAVMFGDRKETSDRRPAFGRPGAAIEPLIDAVQRSLSLFPTSAGTTEQISTSIWAGVHGWTTLELAGVTPQGPRRSVAAYYAHLDSIVRAWFPSS